MAHKEYIRHVSGGEKAVLFVHGFLGSPEHFERFINFVPEDVAVYNMLLQGHGGSVRDFAKASMEAWKKQADDTVSELVEKYNNLIIVGHSMGTFFAMDAAVKYPDNVQSLLLMQSPLKIGVKPVSVKNSLKSMFNLVSDDDPVGRAYQRAHSVKLNLKLWEYIGWVPRYLELFKESKRARSTILKAKSPCVIFQSARDELVSMKSVDYIPEKENINLVILQKSAHFIYDEDDYEQMFDCLKAMLKQEESI